MQRFNKFKRIMKRSYRVSLHFDLKQVLQKNLQQQWGSEEKRPCEKSRFQKQGFMEKDEDRRLQKSHKALNVGREYYLGRKWNTRMK